MSFSRKCLRSEASPLCIEIYFKKFFRLKQPDFIINKFSF